MRWFTSSPKYSGVATFILELTLVLAVLSQSVRVDLVPTAPLRARADVTLHRSDPW
jgi:hypothetical protein